MKKHWMIGSGFLLMAAMQAGDERFFDFDAAEARVPAPFILSEETCYSPARSMKLELEKTAAVFEVKDFTPIKNLGVTFNYRHNEAFRSVRVEAQCLDKQGRVLRGTAASIGRWNGWSRCELFLPGVPNATDSVRLRFHTVDPNTAGQILYLDNLRLTSPPDYESFYPDRFELPQFDQWTRRSPNGEKFLPGGNGEIYHDWHRSKFGEACFLGAGTGATTDFPWRIYNIRVKPDTMYRASFFYSHGKTLLIRSAALNIVFRDKNGQQLPAPAGIMLARTDDWKALDFDFKPPPEAVFMDMRMCFVRAPEGQSVYFNRLSIAPLGPTLRLKTRIDPDRRSLTGKIIAFGLGETPGFSIRATGSDGREYPVSAVNSQGEFTLDLGKMPDGSVELACAGTGIPGASPTLTKTFRNYNRRCWENHGLGELSPTAPPPVPWAPLSYPEKLTVKTWLPAFKFTPQLALAGIESAGHQLLKRPLELKLNGKDIFSLHAAAVRERQTPGQAEFSTRLDGRGFTADITAHTKFHGAVYYRVTLTARQELTIDDLDVIYAPAITDYLQLMREAFSQKCTFSLRELGKLELSALVPTIWCGDEDRGLYTMFTKFHPAREEHSRACHLMNHRGDFITRTVNAPLKLAPGGKFELEFALGSTPVRPPTAPHGALLRFRANRYANMELMWAVPRNLPYCGFPIAPADPKPLNDFLADCRARKKHSFLYQIPFFIMDDLPQFEYFFEKWRVRPERCYSPNTNFYPASMYNLDVAHRSYQDLYLYHLNEFLRQYPFDGLYFDGAGPYAVMTPDGEFSYRIFPVEDFIRRIYILQRAINPESQSFSHAGGSLVSIGSTFSDIIVTGEQFRYFLEKHRYYLQFMSLDEFRLQTGSNIGPARMFLPQYRKPASEDADTACHTMGMVMIHDLGLYPSFIRQSVIDNCRNRLYEFYDSAPDTRFAAYWRQGAINSGNPEIVISAYINANGEFRICLNKSPEEQSFTVPDGWKTEVYDPAADQTACPNPGEKIIIAPYLMKLVTLRR